MKIAPAPRGLQKGLELALISVVSYKPAPQTAAMLTRDQPPSRRTAPGSVASCCALQMAAIVEQERTEAANKPDVYLVVFRNLNLGEADSRGT